jgi:pyridoxal phosphate enzyme (YggS family)
MTGVLPLALVQKQIKSAANAKILAVSKLQSVEKIRDLYAAGQRDFGENYVQEFLEKKKSLSDLKISWHLIGHLQKNKVKTVVGLCHLIHSVDSIELAQEINRRAATAQIQQKILLQVNLAGEASKEGFEPEKLRLEFKNLLALPNVQISGLMTMPPFVDNPEDNRLYFRNLKLLLRELKSNLTVGTSDLFSELSMGTSQDYLVAVQEGATWVRLGSTLFGARR